MSVFNETRTLPRPRPKVTVTFPRGSSPPAPATEAPKKVRASLARYEATLALLRERFPAIFERARPLKIGIHLDLEAALTQEISRTTLRRFLARWTRQEAYRQALSAGVRRIDLDGNDAGPAEPNHPSDGNTV